MSVILTLKKYKQNKPKGRERERETEREANDLAKTVGRLHDNGNNVEMSTRRKAFGSAISMQN